MSDRALQSLQGEMFSSRNLHVYLSRHQSSTHTSGCVRLTYLCMQQPVNKLISCFGASSDNKSVLSLVVWQTEGPAPGAITGNRANN